MRLKIWGNVAGEMAHLVKCCLFVRPYISILNIKASICISAYIQIDVHIIPALGRKQEHPWGSLASQPSQISELLVQ